MVKCQEKDIFLIFEWEDDFSGVKLDHEMQGPRPSMALWPTNSINLILGAMRSQYEAKLVHAIMDALKG